MNRELYELNLEIQKVRRELDEILAHKKDDIGNDLTINVSEKLDILIARYIKISKPPMSGT